MVTLRENTLDLETYLALREAVSWKKLTENQAKRALDLIVLPDYQKMKIGSKIVNNIIEYVSSIKEQDSEIMLCLMCAKGREKFYEGLGFIGRPTENLGPGMIQYIK